MLEKYTTELTRVFRRAPTKHDAHERSRQVLLDMAGDAASLRASLAREIRKPGALNTRNFPSVGITIAHTPYFGLVANCFLSGETDLVANAIHHHGHMLLTTVTAFGPGYEHWRFTTPKMIDEHRELFSMGVIDRMQHHLGHTAFVDADMPHAVVTPPALTVTFALWSSKHPVTWREHAKRLPFVRGREQLFRKVSERLGLERALALNPVQYLDFHPVRDGFKGMRERIQYQRGPNEDFLCSFFHILQATNNEALGNVIEEQLRSGGPIDGPETIQRLLGDLRAERPIGARRTEGIHHLEHMNFKTSAIGEALAALERTTESRPALAAGGS